MTDAADDRSDPAQGRDPLALETTGQQAGVALYLGLGPIFAELYWQHQATWFAGLSPLGAALVSAAAGLVGFALVGQRAVTRVGGALCGALSGFGCSYPFALVYGSAAAAGPARVFVYVGGALPGLALVVPLVLLADRLDARRRPRPEPLEPAVRTPGR